MVTGLRLLKIGGSLLTVKRRLAQANDTAVGDYGRVLAERTRPVILVVGGGSFGNAAAHDDYDPARRDVRALLGDWRDLLEERWRGVGAAVDVILGRELWGGGAEGGRFDDTPLRRALAAGRVPVLLGDLLIGRGRRRLMSSDLLPLLIAPRLPLRRVAMLTDVAGVMVDGQVVRRLDVDRPGVPVVAGPSSAPDSTGGMRLKLRVLGRLARSGVECVVASGAQAGMLRRVLDDAMPPGTILEPRRSPARAVSC